MTALVALMLRLQPEGPGWVAALLAAEFLPPILLSGLIGRLLDGTDMRRLLLVALGVQGVLTVPLALVEAPLATVLLFGALCAFGSLVRPAVNVLVPAICGRELAARGYGRLAIAYGLGTIIGPGLGGVLTAGFGTGVALLLDGATFLALALVTSLLAVRRVPAPDSDHAARGGGFRLVLRTPVLGATLVVSAIATACAVVDNVAGPERFVAELNAGDVGYGLYLALWGIGGLAGSQLPPRVRPASLVTVTGIANLLIGVGIAGIGLAPTTVLALVASVVGGFGNGMVNVASSTLISTLTPSAMHGRAFAAFGALIQTAVGVGTLAGAPLVAALRASGAMTLAGSVAAAVALVGTLALAGRRSELPEPDPLDGVVPPLAEHEGGP